MTLELFATLPKTAMLLQSDIWEDISAFLHMLLDPVVAAMQDEGLRISVLSTTIWSCLIICGLVFVIYEFPTIMNMMSGTSQQSIKHDAQRAKAPRSQAAAASASRHQLSRDKAEKERDRREKAVRKTGVAVTSKIELTNELYLLSVRVKNGSTSQIDMVVVDLDLPTGIDAVIGSFRMQRLGSINAGEEKTAQFMLRPMGGEPSEIGGHVEFLGASYEVSKIPLTVPKMKETMTSE